jgi:centractin
MSQLLLRRAGYVFRTTAEQEVVRQIKEQCCRVAPGEAEVGMPEKVSFTLPDGNVIEVWHKPLDSRSPLTVL